MAQRSAGSRRTYAAWHRLRRTTTLKKSTISKPGPATIPLVSRPACLSAHRIHRVEEFVESVAAGARLVDELAVPGAGDANDRQGCWDRIHDELTALLRHRVELQLSSGLISCKQVRWNCHKNRNMPECTWRCGGRSKGSSTPQLLFGVHNNTRATRVALHLAAHYERGDPKSFESLRDAPVL